MPRSSHEQCASQVRWTASECHVGSGLGAGSAGVDQGTSGGALWQTAVSMVITTSFTGPVGVGVMVVMGQG